MWFLLFFCLIGIMMIDICFDLYDDIFVVMWYWFVCVVIGFNLCLFVKSVYVKEQVCYVISEVMILEDVFVEFEIELCLFDVVDLQQVDMMFVIYLYVFVDFVDYNDVLFFVEWFVQ